MDKKRRICIITGTRAEYGLLYRLMSKIKLDSRLSLQIIATGMHLSPEFGLTYQQIEKDGFKIDRRIDILLSSDTSLGICKSMGLGIIGFAESYEDLKPDLIVVLGDRFEIFSAVSAAAIAKIPVAHLHGGEITEGACDDAMRHSITKMSHLHFTATESYRNRVIQLGEDPEKVFNYGAPGIDNIKHLKLLSKKEFEKAIDFKLANKNLLVTFHPATLEDSSPEKQFKNLLQVFDEQSDMCFIFTKANADAGGRIINHLIDDYVAKNPVKAIAFASLGQLRYLSAMQYVDAVIGNSSSGLIEAPSFKIATINIGNRQKGRIKADSVIDCLPTKASICGALNSIFEPAFIQKLQSVSNPYGQGDATDKIFDVIRSVSLDGLVRKKFYDLRGNGD